MSTKTATVKIEVPSASNPAQTYTVYVGAAGPEFCACPAFKFSRGPIADRKPCKHMRSVASLSVKVA